MKNIVMKIIPNKERKAARKELKKYKKYGVQRDEFEVVPNYGISNVIDASIDADATSIVRDYTGLLKNGTIDKSAPYYIGKDAFRKAIEEFYNGTPGTRAYECTLIDLSRLSNVVRRKILRKSLKKDYMTLVGTSEFDNIKFAAWVVTHAYVTGLFMTPNEITSVMVAISEWEVANKFMWNLFVDSISDIRDSIKHLFTFYSDGEGSCPYLAQKCIISEAHDPAEDEHPTDDQAFDDKADVDRIDLVTADVVNGNKEMDAQYKAAVSKEERKNNDAVMNLSNETVQEEVTMTPPTDNLIHFTPKVDRESSMSTAAVSTTEQQSVEDYDPAEDYGNEQITFGDIVDDHRKNGVINSAVVASVLSNRNRITVDTLPKFIEDNNKQWESIPRLSRFTEIVNNMGKKVLYAPDNEYLGLIDAKVIDDNGDIHRELRIDPCIIYGDTLRVVTTDHPRGDIRLETFVPISDDKRVKQIIEGPLTKDQRRAIIEPIPCCLYVRQKYHFLDRIDLRGISAPGTNTIGLPFNDWRKMITNISNIIKDPNFPICRMRVSEFKDPDNFQLVCDDKVLCAWPTDILSMPSNLKAMSEGFFVNATSDSTKKGTQGYFYTGPEYNTEQKKEENTDKK